VISGLEQTLSGIGGSPSTSRIGLSPVRTEDGDLLVRLGDDGPVLGLIHAARDGYVCYPTTPEFPVVGPVQRVEEAVQLCADYASRSGLAFA
jgi:hypothetical protein